MSGNSLPQLRPHSVTVLGHENMSVLTGHAHPTKLTNQITDESVEISSSCFQDNCRWKLRMEGLCACACTVVRVRVFACICVWGVCACMRTCVRA